MGRIPRTTASLSRAAFFCRLLVQSSARKSRTPRAARGGHLPRVRNESADASDGHGRRRAEKEGNGSRRGGSTCELRGSIFKRRIVCNLHSGCYEWKVSVDENSKRHGRRISAIDRPLGIAARGQRRVRRGRRRNQSDVFARRQSADHRLRFGSGPFKRNYFCSEIEEVAL